MQDVLDEDGEDHSHQDGVLREEGAGTSAHGAPWRQPHTAGAGRQEGRAQRWAGTRHPSAPPLPGCWDFW